MRWQSPLGPALIWFVASCANEPGGPVALPVPLDARAAQGMGICAAPGE